MCRPTGREDQHVLVAERRERLTDAIMPARIAHRLHRKLRHFHIGFRVEGFERHPGAVIEAVFGIAARRNVRLVQQIEHALGERRRARRGIADLIELRREAVEIVDRLRLLGGRDQRQIREPMRRDRQHRVRPRQALGKVMPEIADFARRERQRRRAVRDEKSGKCVFVMALRWDDRRLRASLA